MFDGVFGQVQPIRATLIFSCDQAALRTPLSVRLPVCHTFIPEASFGLRVLSSPASVGLCVRVCVCINHELVRTITHRPFKLGSPNLDQRCKTPWFRSQLFVGMIDRPWSSRSNVTWKSNLTPFWIRSHHYSSAIQARITKFGPKMHLNTVNIAINFGLDWFWSSLSFQSWNLFFYQIYLRPFYIYLVRPVACKY